MDNLTQKICDYLRENPNSNVREICKEISAGKSDVNSCLYANEGTRFFKEGLTPPLWRNVFESSGSETAETELAEIDDSQFEDEFKIDDKPRLINSDEDWTRLDAEDQKDYLAIKARIDIGEKITKQDRSRMNQLKNRIYQSVRNEITFIESAERKLRNRAEYAARVNEEVNEAWSAEEQRAQAIAALSLQFESNLRRMAYGRLLLSKEMNSEQENDSEVENQKVKANNLIRRFSSTVSTRLGNLENMSDEELVRSTVGFAWINRDRTTRPDSKSSTEMFPQFEDIEEVKIYRSRFQKIVQRLNGA
jgi:hypothetical protein